MLCRKFRINKKGMTLQVIIVLVLIIFAMLVIVIISNNRVNQIKNIGSSCEANGGACVEPKDCDACDNFADCGLKFPYGCENKKNIEDKNEPRKVCCLS